MTYYSACVGCAVERKTCTVLATFRERLKGMSATTVKHKCAARRPAFEPGMAVKVRVYADLEVFPKDAIIDTFRGTFVGFLTNQRRCICFIAPGTKGSGGEQFMSHNGTGFVKINIRHVLPLPNEPRVDITPCKACAQIPALQGCQGGDLTKLACPHAKRASFLGGALVLADDSWIDPDRATDIGADWPPF